MFSLDFVAGNNFTVVWNFIVNVFLDFFDWHSHIKIFGNFSMLDFDIAIIIFGVIFSIVFTVVKSGVNNSISTKNRQRAAAERSKKG